MSEKDKPKDKLSPEETKEILRELGFEPIDGETERKWRYVTEDEAWRGLLTIGRDFTDQYPTGRFWARVDDEETGKPYFLSNEEMREIPVIQKFYEMRNGKAQQIKTQQPSSQSPQNAQEEEGGIEGGMLYLSAPTTRVSETVPEPRKTETMQKRETQKREEMKPMGHFYHVSGKMVPDAWKVRQWGNEKNISTEIVAAFQNEKCAHATVRAIAPTGQHIDATVYHDYEIAKELMMFELIERYAKKGKSVIEGYDEDGKPQLTPEAKRDLYKRYIRFKSFALRDAVTKAERIALLKILNKDWREEEEIESEMREVREVKMMEE